MKRFVRTIALPRRPPASFTAHPGPKPRSISSRRADLDAATGEWRRPWVFRMTPATAAATRTPCGIKLEAFLRLHERAFHDPGVLVVRHDNPKRLWCVRASSIPTVTTCIAFAAHWGYACRPTAPSQENGKQGAAGYVKK